MRSGWPILGSPPRSGPAWFSVSLRNRRIGFSLRSYHTPPAFAGPASKSYCRNGFSDRSLRCSGACHGGSSEVAAEAGTFGTERTSVDRGSGETVVGTVARPHRTNSCTGAAIRVWKNGNVIRRGPVTPVVTPDSYEVLTYGQTDGPSSHSRQPAGIARQR